MEGRWRRTLSRTSNSLIFRFVKSRYDVAVNDSSVEHFRVVERPRMAENDAPNRRGLPASCSIKFSQYYISFSPSTAYLCRRRLVQAARSWSLRVRRKRRSRHLGSLRRSRYSLSIQGESGLLHNLTDRNGRRL